MVILEARPAWRRGRLLKFAFNEKVWKIAFRNLEEVLQMEPNANVRRVKIYTFVSFAMRTLWSGSVLSNWIMVKTVREDTTLACACGVWSGGG